MRWKENYTIALDANKSAGQRGGAGIIARHHHGYSAEFGNPIVVAEGVDHSAVVDDGRGAGCAGGGEQLSARLRIGAGLLDAGPVGNALRGHARRAGCPAT